LAAVAGAAPAAAAVAPEAATALGLGVAAALAAWSFAGACPGARRRRRLSGQRLARERDRRKLRRALYSPPLAAALALAATESLP
jgi:hypothetical protein